MSDYGAYDDDRRDEPRRYKNSRIRPRGRNDPDYIEETTYVEKGKGPPPRDLVYRPRDREDSVEDIPRDFPPPSRNPRSVRDDDYDDEPPRRRRPRSIAGRSYDDDYDDYAAGAAGGAGGYALSRRKSGHGSSRRDREGYYSDEYERYDRYSDSGSRSPRKEKDKDKERRKSGIETTLEGLGLGGVVGALTGKSRSKSRSRAGSPGSDRSRSRGPKGGKSERQWAQAAQAAIVAGAIEAFRARNEPGGWSGSKGKRVATAAIGAGGIDKLVDRDPNNKSKRHLVEAVIGGLAANRLANGPREKSTDRGRGRSTSPGKSRSRSRSVFDRFRSKSRGRSRSPGGSQERSQSKGGVGLEKLAAGGALAAAGKAIYDRMRSKSRDAKDRRRSPSNSSEDSYVPSRSRRRDVGSSRSIGDGNGPDDRAVSRRAGAGALVSENGGKPKSTGDGKDASSDTSSTSALEEKRKKMKGKELITAGLATVATIHAAHSVYQSVEGTKKRHELVEEGKMTPAEAKKKRRKAWLQDAAAVGIAALGIKGAYSEWKEMNESRQNVRELIERRDKRRERLVERRKDAGRSDDDYGRRDRRSSSLPPPRDSGRLPPPPSEPYYDGPTAYQDANPYSAHLPPPPVGASNAGYH